MSTAPSRFPFEAQIADMPAHQQYVIRNLWNSISDAQDSIPILKSQIDAAKTSASTTSGSSSSSSTTGVTPAQASSIATQTLQTTLGTVDNQTATTYVSQNSDYGGIVTINNASAVAVQLGGDGTGVGPQWFAYFENIGAGTATLTPANSATINGAASITLVTNQGAIVFYNGTAWFALTSIPGSGGTITDVIAGTGLTGGGSSGAVTVSLATPVSVADGGTGTPTPGLVAGSGISVTGSWPDQTIAATGGGGGVTSLDTITGAITLVAGSGISITDNTPSAGDITIAATGGGGGYLKGSVSINFTGGAGTYLGNTTIAGASGGMAVAMCAPPTSPNASIGADLINLYADIDPSTSIIYCSADYRGGGSGIGSISFPLVVFP